MGFAVAKVDIVVSACYVQRQLLAWIGRKKRFKENGFDFGDDDVVSSVRRTALARFTVRAADSGRPWPRSGQMAKEERN